MAEYFDERNHYLRKLSRDAATVFWKTDSGARARFDAIISQTGLAGQSVLDVGCGDGGLVGACQRHGIEMLSYVGMDILPEFVEAARHKWPGLQFVVADVTEGNTDAWQADWVIANGLFGHAQAGNWQARFDLVTKKMWSACRVGIAYTLVSANSPSRNQDAHYVDPEWAAADAHSRFTPATIVDHSYLPNDFLVVAFKKPRWKV